MKDTQRNYFLMAAVAIALVVAGCATSTGPQYEVIMDPDAPVTEAPADFGVGSTWTGDITINGETERSTGTLVEKVDYEGREVYLISDSMPQRDPGSPCDGADSSLWDPANESWIACLKEGKVLASTGPNNGRFAWPLQVGKSWRTEYYWTDKILHPEWSGSSWEEFTVLAWEEVTVPAGTFMAYKVARTKGAWETAREETYINWYAPDLQTAIKAVWSRSEKNGYGPVEGSWELVSHERK